MQTLPAFSLPFPSVLLFGLGNVTALIATFYFSQMPPAVLDTDAAWASTSSQTTLEAARSFRSDGMAKIN